MIKDARVGCHNSQAPARLHTCPRATVGVSAISKELLRALGLLLHSTLAFDLRSPRPRRGGSPKHFLWESCAETSRAPGNHRVETGRGNFWQSGRSVSRVEVQTGKLPPTRLLRKSISAKLRQICNQQATPPTFRKSLREIHKQDPVYTSSVLQLHLLFWFPWLNLLNEILDAKERSN